MRMPTNEMLDEMLDQAVTRIQHSIQHLEAKFVFDLDQTSFDDPTSKGQIRFLCARRSVMDSRRTDHVIITTVESRNSTRNIYNLRQKLLRHASFVLKDAFWACKLLTQPPSPHCNVG